MWLEENNRREREFSGIQGRSNSRCGRTKGPERCHNDRQSFNPASSPASALLRYLRGIPDSAIIVPRKF
jgi:hypothetical protein